MTVRPTRRCYFLTVTVVTTVGSPSVPAEMTVMASSALLTAFIRCAAVLHPTAA